MGNKMQTYKQCSIKLEIGVNGVISQPAILGSIEPEALITLLSSPAALRILKSIKISFNTRIISTEPDTFRVEQRRKYHQSIHCQPN